MSDTKVAKLLEDFDYLNAEEINETIKIVNERNHSPSKREMLLKSILLTKNIATKKSQVLEAFPKSFILDEEFCSITRGTAQQPFLFPLKYKRPPSGFAVLIGCTYAGTPDELKGPSHDVQSMYSMLTTCYNWGPGDILVMTDVASDGSKYEYHMIPTKANILKVTAELRKGAISEDVLFFYFSGHSRQTLFTDEELDEPDDKGETIMACDHGIRPGNMSISGDVLRNLLCDKLPGGAELYCVFDSCHSGAILGLPCYDTFGAFAYKTGNNNIMCISCRSKDPRSYNDGTGEESQGVLTRILKLELTDERNAKPLDLILSLNSTFSFNGHVQRATLCSPNQLLYNGARFAPVCP